MAADLMTAPRAEALIDLGALRRNIELLAEHARRSGAATMAVVKADAYGHGAAPVAKAALHAGATWLGTAAVEEALALRAEAITAPILCWLHVPDQDFAAPIAAGIDLGVSSTRSLGRIVKAANTIGHRARVHLKIDTGLSRNGCPPGEWAELVRLAAAEDAVEVVAVWSHLACADEPDHPANDKQAEEFAAAYAVALDAGLRPLRHLANSAATLTRPDLHFDIVRAGIACYGLNPVPGHTDLALRPAMTFRSCVVSTKRIPAGQAVSYGHTWTAPRDTNLALVPVGYADGVPRALSGRMDVLLAGARRPIVGRVCMDQIIVDCGDDRIEDGAEVVLFGPGDRGEPTAREWADTLGTIDYEIVTGMYRVRVPRRYIP